MVMNTGNATRTYPLAGVALAGSEGSAVATVTLQGLSGQRLAPASLTLQPGEGQDVVLNVTAQVPGAATGLLQASCTPDVTAQGKAVVQATLLPLTASKSVSASSAKPGDTLTYTITVTNPNPVSLGGVTVTDTLDPHLQFLDATPAAQQQEQTLTFALPAVPPQGSVTITVRSRLGVGADGLTVENTARASSADLPTPVPTNTVSTTVWDPRLVIDKVSAKTVVTVGDQVPYTVTVTNASKTARLERVTVKDTLPEGLSLTAGTLTLNGQAASDTNPDPRVIEVDGGGLGPGEGAVLRYSTVVTPAAFGKASLRNVAMATASSPSRPGVQVTTPEVDAIVKVNAAERAVLLGRVYLDADQDGRFQEGVDRPVKGARVVVAGGEAALTDALGRYAVPGLRAGRYAVALDRASVPYATGPGDLLQSGAHLLNVYGVATADFPLRPPAGSGTAERTTLLLGEGWRLHKTLARQGEQITVTLTLSATRPVTLHLDDPLPPGAALQQGQPTWTGTLTPGQSVTLRYTFTSALPDTALTTDPSVRAQGASK